MARGKKYKDADKEKAMAALAVNDNAEEVSREMKIPARTLREWKNNGGTAELFAELRQQKKEEFVCDAWDIIHKANERVLETIQDASPSQAATIAAIYYDKQALASGEQPANNNVTVNTIVQNTPPENRRAVIDELIRDIGIETGSP